MFIFPLIISIITIYSPVLNLADFLFKQGEYQSAITEYKRYLFFNPSTNLTSHSHYRIGIAYRNSENWDEALNAMRLAISTAPNDSIRNEREIDLSIILIASGNYSAAEFQLLKVESFSRFPDIRRRATFFRGIACLYNLRLNKAREALGAFFSPDSFYLAALDSIFDSVEGRAKSESFAKTLSTFIPGAGQIYAGDLRNGLNAFLLNTLLGGLVVSSIISENYAIAVSDFLFLFYRYYTANRYNAEKIAEQYNLHLNQKIAESIFSIL